MTKSSKKFRFTSVAIKNLPLTTSGRLVFWDEKCSGLGISIGKTKKSYILQNKIKGGPEVRLTLGVHGQMGPMGKWTPDTARRRANELLADLAAGIDPRKQKKTPGNPTGITWREGIARHMKSLKLREKTPGSIAVFSPGGDLERHLGDDWLDRPIAEMMGSDLTDLYMKILEETPARAGSVNKPGAALGKNVVSRISAVWNTVQRSTNGQLPGWNPALGVKTKALKPKLLRIPDDGFPAWLDAAMGLSRVRRDLNFTVLFSGLRSGSVCQLRWSDIDRDNKTLHVRIAKGDKPYSLPLTATLLALLESREEGNNVEFPHGDEGWIFPTVGRDGDVRPLRHPKEHRVVKGVRSRHAVLIGLHGLRCTFNSIAEEIGIPQEHRETLMNHSKSSSVNGKHYVARESMKHLILISERIEQAILERLGVDCLDELLGLSVDDADGKQEQSEDDQLSAILGQLGGDSELTATLTAEERTALLSIQARLREAA